MPQKTPPTPHVQDTPDAAAYCGVSTRYFEKLRGEGGGPRFCKLGRRTVYLTSELDRWLLSRLRSSTSDVGATQQAASGR